MEILVGRENSSLRRLQLTVGDMPQCYGEAGCVPKSVSRQHCKLVIEGERYRIESIKDENLIYVNGKEVLSKNLKPGDRVELGDDRYRLLWETLLDMYMNSVNGYSLAHLKPIWEKYDKEKLNMQISSSRFNAISSIPMILSVASGALSAMPSLAGCASILRYSCGLLLVSFVIIRIVNSSKLPLKQRELEQWFHQNYVCPNPKCRRFLGNQPFDDLVKNAGCSNCKSKYRPY